VPVLPQLASFVSPRELGNTPVCDEYPTGAAFAAPPAVFQKLHPPKTCLPRPKADKHPRGRRRALHTLDFSDYIGGKG